MAHVANDEYTPLFSNRVYDVLKYIALVILPAASALYFGLGEIWDLPKVTEVIGTISVLDTVLGMIIRSDNIRYRNSDARFDGKIAEVEVKGDNNYSLDVKGDPAEVLETQEEVLLKVSPEVAPVEVVETPPSPKPPPRKRAPRKKPVVGIAPPAPVEPPVPVVSKKVTRKAAPRNPE